MKTTFIKSILTMLAALYIGMQPSSSLAWVFHWDECIMCDYSPPGPPDPPESPPTHLCSISINPDCDGDYFKYIPCQQSVPNRTMSECQAICSAAVEMKACPAVTAGD
jgi:hypothetical protein